MKAVPGAANNDARMDIDTTMADTRPANRDFDSRKHRDSAKFDISSRAWRGIRLKYHIQIVLQNVNINPLRVVLLDSLNQPMYDQAQ